jgi:hypothetical protein
MTTLRDLQETFQRAIVEGDDAVLAEIVDTSKEKRDVLFDVYRNAYVLRLIEFLANDYEKLKALLGEEQFDAMARAYVAATPSRTPNARWYGHRLPEFLRTEPDYAGVPEMADLAALEKALTDAFDADDAASLTMDELADLEAESWGALTFRPHPSAARIDLSTNATDIWRALHRDETPPSPATGDKPVPVLVSREDGMASFRVLEDDEAMMWDEAANGVSFAVLCEMMAAHAGEEQAAPRAAGFLSAWIQRGLLARA